MLIWYVLLLILGLAIMGMCILNGKRKVGRRKTFVISVLTYMVGFVTVVQMLYIPLFQDEFTITVINDKNEKAINKEVYIDELIIDLKGIRDVQIVQGTWVDDGEYQIYSPLYEDVTHEITIKIPVGKERNIIFSKAPSCGMVLVEDGKGFSVLHDLYSSEECDYSVAVPSSGVKIRVADVILRIGIFVLILLLEQIILAKCVNIGWNKAVKILSDRKVCYVLFLMFGFFVFYVQHTSTPEQVVEGGYRNVYYFENYELGYLSRGFMGEVLNSILPYWTPEALFIFKSSIAFIFFLIVSICVAEVISRLDDKWMAMLIAGIVFAYPWARLIFMEDMNSDICLYLFYVISICLIYRAKRSLIFVPLLSMLIVLTNETTCLTLIPSIFMLVLYRLCKTKEKRYMGILGGIGFSTIALTAINLIYGKGGNIGLVDTFENIQAHFGGALGIGALNAEYYALADHVKLTYGNYLKHWIAWLGVGVICVPIFYLLGIFVKNLYLKYIVKYEMRVRVVFALLILCSFSPVSAMTIAIDHPRYISLIFIILVGHVLFFMAEGNVQISMDEMHMFQKEKKSINLLPMGIVFFYFIIRTMGATSASSLPQIEKWFHYFGG